MAWKRVLSMEKRIRFALEVDFEKRPMRLYSFTDNRDYQNRKE